MERVRTSIVALLALAPLAACGGGDDPAAPADEPAAQQTPAQQADEPGAPTTAPQPVDLADADLETWHAYYYLDPTPDRLEAYMLHLAEKEHFRDFDRAYSTGAFVAKILQQNPELADPIAVRLRDVPFRQRWGFNYGLWLSGISGANDILDREAQLLDNPHLREQLLAFVGPEPFDVLGVEEIDPRTVDMLWESFYATGDEAYVVRTMTVLPDPAVPDDSRERRRLTNAAAWVLAQNCFRHRRVMDIARSAAESDLFTPGVRDSIREAIGKAEQRLETQASPDPLAR